MVSASNEDRLKSKSMLQIESMLGMISDVDGVLCPGTQRGFDVRRFVW